MHPSIQDMLDALSSMLREEPNYDIRNRIMAARRELLALQQMES